MKVSTALFALVSAGFACAQNSFNVPPGGYAPSAGSSVNISWTPSTQGTVSLYLRSGNSAYLENGTAIAASIANSGQYTWSVPGDILRGDSYTLEIVSDSDTSQVNYTPQFSINSNNLYSTTSGVSGSAVSTPAPSASAASSGASKSGSATTTGTSSGSSGSSTGSAGSTSAGTVQPLSTSSHPGAAGPRATAAAGMLGVLAIGALAL